MQHRIPCVSSIGSPPVLTPPPHKVRPLVVRIFVSDLPRANYTCDLRLFLLPSSPPLRSLHSPWSRVFQTKRSDLSRWEEDLESDHSTRKLQTKRPDTIKRVMGWGVGREGPCVDPCSEFRRSDISVIIHISVVEVTRILSRTQNLPPSHTWLSHQNTDQVIYFPH